MFQKKKIKMNFIQIGTTIDFIGLVCFWLYCFRKTANLYMKKEEGYKRKIRNVYFQVFIGALVFIIVFIFFVTQNN